MAMRQCIATGQKEAPDRLIRFVAGPDGALVPDLAERLPGRGAWLLSTPQAVSRAVQKKAFARHLDIAEQALAGDADKLNSQLAQLLADYFVQSLALCRRAGLAVGGAGSLREAGPLDGLLIADDASPREAAKLTGAVQPDWTIKGVPADLLGQAFGRESLAFAGLLAGSHPGQAALRQKIRTSWGRLDAFIGLLTCQERPGRCITGPQAGTGKQPETEDRTAQEGAR